MFKYISILIISILCLSCQSNEVNNSISPLDRLADDMAGELVRKSIENIGGWEAWDSKKDFSFYKNITQVDSAGQIIREVKQLHQYMLNPDFQARMTWRLDSSDFVIINNGMQAKKYGNGIELTDDKSKNEAWNSSFGSHYVVSMPFKLTDPGTLLSYDGIDSVTFDKPVHSLKVDYEKGAGSTGGMHKWWYYFDTESHNLVANYLDYGTGYSLTEYETSEIVNGIKLHKKRYSYASNEHKQKLHLKTIYENTEMSFDNNLKPSLFKLK